MYATDVIPLHVSPLKNSNQELKEINDQIQNMLEQKPLESHSP